MIKLNNKFMYYIYERKQQKIKINNLRNKTSTNTPTVKLQVFVWMQQQQEEKVNKMERTMKGVTEVDSISNKLNYDYQFIIS